MNAKGRPRPLSVTCNSAAPARHVNAPHVAVRSACPTSKHVGSIAPFRAHSGHFRLSGLRTYCCNTENRQSGSEVDIQPRMRATASRNGENRRAGNVTIHLNNLRAHHSGPDNSSQAPATTQTTPTPRAIHRPIGVSFSRRTSSARSAIQRTFITPPTNRSAIRAQQQPTQ